MDTRKDYPRNGACNNYNWDAWSAGRKLVSGATFNGVVVSKSVPHNDPNVDAYRRCSNCQRHFNYHTRDDNNYKYRLR